MSQLLVGRERELAALDRVLDPGGPRVCFVYGMSGIGKSALLNGFAERCAAAGVSTVRVDCRSIDPTEQSFRDALGEAGERLVTGAEPAVLLVDTYEVFRIADPWLRQELLPSLAPSARVVVASRDAPMLEWSVERGRLGGLEVLPLAPLEDEAVQRLLADVGIPDATAGAVTRLARGHPLALRLALEAQVADVSPDETLPHVVGALAAAFRDGLDERSRRVLDAAAVPRPVTRGLLAAMLGEADADEALELLSRLSFVEHTTDGLRLHDAVHAALGSRLRAVDPSRFRWLRTAAWRHVQTEMSASGAGELARSTADLLFLIDNPFVREAMFPTTTHDVSVEPCRPADVEAVRELWHRYESPEGAQALEAWLRLLPRAIRVVRDRAGAVVGCSVVAEWRDVPPALERADPVVAGWARYDALHPLPAGMRTLVHRRVLVRGTGEGPSSEQAACWLDVKRDYFPMRLQFGRLLTGIADPTPFLPALLTLGFTPFDEPVMLGSVPFHLAVLNTGEGSVDGWLSRLAAAELGIADRPFLDASDRTAVAAGIPVQLSRLEFGVLEVLATHPGRAVARVDLLERVWGTTYDGGSNVVDVVVRGLRQKLGSDGARVETVRGVGYRLR
jgi:hypothetical protein